MTDLIHEIAELKARENATILAHYYQEGEIQELADFTGDSLKLARAATTRPSGGSGGRARNSATGSRRFDRYRLPDAWRQTNAA